MIILMNIPSLQKRGQAVSVGGGLITWRSGQAPTRTLYLCPPVYLLLKYRVIENSPLSRGVDFGEAKRRGVSGVDDYRKC